MFDYDLVEKMYGENMTEFNRLLDINMYDDLNPSDGEGYKERVRHIVRLTLSTGVYGSAVATRDLISIEGRREARQFLSHNVSSLMESMPDLMAKFTGYEYTAMVDALQFMHELMAGRILPFAPGVDEAKVLS